MRLTKAALPRSATRRDPTVYRTHGSGPVRVCCTVFLAGVDGTDSIDDNRDTETQKVFGGCLGALCSDLLLALSLACSTFSLPTLGAVFSITFLLLFTTAAP